MSSSLHYTLQGQGSCLLLLHGFCEASDMWAHWLPELSQHFQVLALDLGGFGQSAAALPQPCSISALAEQVADTLQNIGIERCMIVGHSLGGYVALALAEQNPELLQGLVLFHSTALADSPEKQQMRNKVIDFVQKVGVERFIESFVSPLFYKERLQELQEAVKRVENLGKKTPLQSIVEVSKAMRDRPDRSEVLAKAAFPIMFIIGKQDASVPLESYREQVFLPKNATVHILDATGHMGMFERPAETLPLVLDFALRAAQK